MGSIPSRSTITRKQKVMDPKKVNLHQAYHWECPNCNRDYFGLMRPADVPEEDAEEMEELAEELGIEGRFVSAPKWVNCPVCNLEFEVNW